MREEADSRKIQELIQTLGRMIQGGWVEPGLLASHFAAIEGQLYRYPALDPETFRQAVEKTISIF